MPLQLRILGSVVILVLTAGWNAQGLIAQIPIRNAPVTSNVTISSTPSGGEIFVDEHFVGNTPSSIGIPIGKHWISVRTKGFQEWRREVTLPQGNINLIAELAKERDVRAPEVIPRSADVKPIKPGPMGATSNASVRKDDQNSTATAHNLTPGGQPATPSQRVAKKIPHPAPVKYLTEPFDITSSRLQPGFKGHDIAAISKAVTSAQESRVRSEFETSDQYAERKRLFGQPILLGSVTTEEYLAFVGEVPFSLGDPDEPMGSGILFGRYDADKQLLHVTIAGGQYSGKDAIATRWNTTGEKVYAARNAFGAQVNVTETNSMKYGLVMDPISWVFPEAHASLPNHWRSFERAIAMAPEKARLFIPHAQVLFVCKLTHDNWSFSSMARSEATFDSPNAMNIEKHYLHVNLLQIWVFDSSTGDVVVKFTDDRPRLPTS
jgi:PEGA domain